MKQRNSRKPGFGNFVILYFVGATYLFSFFIDAISLFGTRTQCHLPIASYIFLPHQRVKSHLVFFILGQYISEENIKGRIYGKKLEGIFFNYFQNLAFFLGLLWMLKGIIPLPFHTNVAWLFHIPERAHIFRCHCFPLVGVSLWWNQFSLSLPNFFNCHNTLPLTPFPPAEGLESPCVHHFYKVSFLSFSWLSYW